MFYTQDVGGSSPSLPTNDFNELLAAIPIGLAQRDALGNAGGNG
jgi:hypothetical protein